MFFYSLLFSLNGFAFPYKYILGFCIYLIKYENTYTMFSWLNPIILNSNNGNVSIININIFKFRLLKIKLHKQYIKTYHITFIIAVE